MVITSIYRHHRTDALSSAVVMFAIVGSYAGLPVLDPLGGLVVAGMIFKSSIEMTTSSLKELADRSIDADDLDKVKRTMIQMKVGIDKPIDPIQVILTSMIENGATYNRFSFVAWSEAWPVLSTWYGTQGSTPSQCIGRSMHRTTGSFSSASWLWTCTTSAGALGNIRKRMYTTLDVHCYTDIGHLPHALLIKSIFVVLPCFTRS